MFIGLVKTFVEYIGSCRARCDIIVTVSIEHQTNKLKINGKYTNNQNIENSAVAFVKEASVRN